MPDLTKKPEMLKKTALKLGFDAVGIAPAVAVPHADAFLRWLDAGRQAEMAYLQTGRQARADILSRFPWAKTVISLATSYNGPAPETGPFRLSRYAAGDDYHRLIEKRLHALNEFILRAHNRPKQTRYYIDTGPLLEREYAQMAGLGWIGKNTNLISKSLGSYIFLSEIITNLPIPPDEPHMDHCGTCTACIDACPTAALVEPYVLDANRCIAYLNVEKRGPFTDEQAAMVGNHLIGCDICQEVCPWNNDAPPTKEKKFHPRSAYAKLTLDQITQMDEVTFQSTFSGSAIKRARLDGLKRNAAAVVRNSQENPLNAE